ncbi:MAG: hypothetical protein OS130_14950 [Thermodesulfobacteriota bacterium]|jgi:hypothetical protein|nr:MAG: hypothetical protein OS130_14950 [Thermodesulfobacteriota bacterium]
MAKSFIFLPFIALWFLTGCQTTQQFLDKKEPKALQVAQSRAQFEMNCPDATVTVISKDVLPPIVFGGVERAQFTIGAEGCGKRGTYTVICPGKQDNCWDVSRGDPYGTSEGGRLLQR